MRAADVAERRSRASKYPKQQHGRRQSIRVSPRRVNEDRATLPTNKKTPLAILLRSCSPQTTLISSYLGYTSGTYEQQAMARANSQTADNPPII